MINKIQNLSVKNKITEIAKETDRFFLQGREQSKDSCAIEQKYFAKNLIMVYNCFYWYIKIKDNFNK